MMAMKRGRRSGLTMIEVMVSSIILFMIIAMASWLVWSSSKHVANNEVILQMDMQLREIISVIAKDIRQTRFARIEMIDSSTVPRTNAALISGSNIGTKILPLVPGTAYTGIRFRIPGKAMEITSANAGNFDVTAYAADKSGSQNDITWTTEVQYYWEVDESAGEGFSLGNNPYLPDGKDNNSNGIIDEGVIKRIETTVNAALTPTSRTVSVLARGVRGPTAAKGITFTLLAATTGDTTNAVASQNGNRIQVQVTLERVDPSYPKQTIVRQMTSIVEMRNN